MNQFEQEYSVLQTDQSTSLDGRVIANTVDYSTVAVLIPCFNEEITVGKVVSDLKAALPGAKVYVFDNNSTDRTAEIARLSGATVFRSPKQGKGHVVQHMFGLVDSPVYMMIDGDDTYPASAARRLLDEFHTSGAGMVVGARMASFEIKAFRRFHQLGNRLVTWLISKLFRAPITDVMSGYRVFSRDFARSIPLLAGGFEIETEMTLQALTKGYLIREVPITYGTRPKGSYSKLNTFSDGLLVLRTIFLIFKAYKPLLFFTCSAIILAFLSLASGWLPIHDYVTTGYVFHVPRAILAAALGILSAISLVVGIILDTLVKYQLETFQLWRKLLNKS